MIKRMEQNDEIVTRYMADREFQGAASPVLAKEMCDVIHTVKTGEARCRNWHRPNLAFTCLNTCCLRLQ
jgi:hypothetical protein